MADMLKLSGLKQITNLFKGVVFFNTLLVLWIVKLNYKNVFNFYFMRKIELVYDRKKNGNRLLQLFCESLKYVRFFL